MSEQVTLTIDRFMTLKLNHEIEKRVDVKKVAESGNATEMIRRGWQNWTNDAIGGKDKPQSQREKDAETRIAGIEEGRVVGGGKESDPLLKGLRIYCQGRGCKVADTNKWTYDVIRTYLGADDFVEVVDAYTSAPFKHEMTPECEKHYTRK